MTRAQRAQLIDQVAVLNDQKNQLEREVEFLKSQLRGLYPLLPEGNGFYGFRQEKTLFVINGLTNRVELQIVRQPVVPPKSLFNLLEKHGDTRIFFDLVKVNVEATRAALSRPVVEALTMYTPAGHILTKLGRHASPDIDLAKKSERRTKKRVRPTRIVQGA